MGMIKIGKAEGKRVKQCEAFITCPRCDEQIPAHYQICPKCQFKLK